MTTSPPAALASYPFVHWEDVRFRDLDAFVHVNNAVYATYFESARLAYYHLLTGKGIDQADIILAEMTISYHAPALMADRLAIGIKVSSIGTKSFVMEHAIYRSGDEVLIASGRSVLVAYDYQAGASKAVPDAFRTAVAAHQGQ